MTTGSYVQRSLAGAWRLMTGRSDGLAELDLSVDGFWNSFYAMIVAFPVLIVGWVTLANQLGGDGFGGRLGIVTRLALIDFAAWVVPIAALALVAPRVGIAHRFVPFVVATNWGSAILIWLMLPVSLVELIMPEARQLADGLSLVIFIATLVLSWRLTNNALGLGAGVASAVFAGTFAVSLFVVLALQSLFGLSFS